MKKLGIVPILMLMLATAAVAIDTGSRDHSITVMNASSSQVTVAILWSGGGVAPVKLAAGETHVGVVPANIDSVKVTADGHCRQGVQTFNPQRVDRVTIDCKGDSYTIKLEEMKPAP
ncbi:MAG TPA: hypothetical protein VFR03_07705 [Thermoanaerobaculia bacterium]|nr:hypothetical protein [Thermoanaerobaculia bacterium]